MTIEYMIRCDGCGRLIASSRKSARAARTEGLFKSRAHSSGGEDWCADCTSRKMKELAEQAKLKANDPRVSWGHWPGPSR